MTQSNQRASKIFGTSDTRGLNLHRATLTVALFQTEPSRSWRRRARRAEGCQCTTPPPPAAPPPPGGGTGPPSHRSVHLRKHRGTRQTFIFWAKISIFVKVLGHFCPGKKESSWRLCLWTYLPTKKLPGAIRNVYKRPLENTRVASA